VLTATSFLFDGLGCGELSVYMWPEREAHSAANNALQQSHRTLDSEPTPNCFGVGSDILIPSQYDKTVTQNCTIWNVRRSLATEAAFSCRRTSALLRAPLNSGKTLEYQFFPQPNSRETVDTCCASWRPLWAKSQFGAFRSTRQLPLHPAPRSAAGGQAFLWLP
jgi:hypothetical protein